MSSDSDKHLFQSDKPHKRRHSLRWQIMSIAMIGTFGFFVFLAVMLAESKDRADLLKNIRDVRYPAQEKLLAAHHGLEYIDSSMEQAIATSNARLLDHTMTLAGEFRSNLHSAMGLEQTHLGDLKEILSDFDEYYHHSHSLAQKVISQESLSISIPREKQKIAHMFNTVVAALGAMQTEQTDFLITSVDTATLRADESLKAGITTGVLTAMLLFLVGVFTTRSILQRINNMVSSLRQIATGNGDMSVRIPLTGSDEMTELAYWFNTFIGKLQHVTTESTTEIKRLAYTDTLTSLPNRRMFLDCLNKEIEHLQKSKDNKSLAVMFLDLDNFKPINDQLGHDAGDELLRIVALRLHDCIRTSDTVANNKPEVLLDYKPGESVVARLAGDEFMLIISNLDDSNQAEVVAQRIHDAHKQPISLAGTECNVGVSIGICLYPEFADTAESLIARADIAMYEAKNMGKNRYRFYDPKLQEATELKSKLDKAIKNAIENDELSLLYQPAFNLKSGKLIGAEALLRWKNTELGTFTPAEFISVAEANGTICDIDDWVMSSVINQISDWQGRNISQINISLNFSASQACRLELADAMASIAGEKQHLLKQIEIEITETSAIDNLTAVENNIHELKQKGIKIAMDDFGAGHSSLTLLTRCPIDTLKIDKEVTCQIKDDSKSRIIVQSMIDLAKSLEVDVCAEGIEDEAQTRLLREMGCKFGQGYYLSEPLTAVQMTTLMELQSHMGDKAA